MDVGYQRCIHSNGATLSFQGIGLGILIQPIAVAWFIGGQQE